MNRYKIPAPRARFAIAAAAMSVLTFAVAVIVPSELASHDPEAGVLAGSNVVKLAPIDVVFSPARIDAAGDCAPEAMVERDDVVGLKSEQRG
jgi:hypothetical protein